MFPPVPVNPQVPAGQDSTVKKFFSTLLTKLYYCDTVLSG